MIKSTFALIHAKKRKTNWKLENGGDKNFNKTNL